MDHDVFISYAAGDKAIAGMVCDHLERHGVRCWIAPRDLAPGATWLAGAVIDQTIQRSRVVIAVFSKRADKSSDVDHQLRRALATNVPVLALRLAATKVTVMQELSRGFRFVEVDNPPSPTDLQKLISVVRLMIGRAPSPRAGVETSELSRGESVAVTGAHRMVFLSAKSSDYGYAKQIYDFLVSNGVSVFFSEETLTELGSSDYRKEIDRALDAAKHMVVVTSSVENTLSPWVEAEWGFFINEKRSGRKPGNLITVLVGSLQPADLPPSLRQYQAVPLATESLPKLLRFVAGPRSVS